MRVWIRCVCAAVLPLLVQAARADVSQIPPTYGQVLVHAVPTGQGEPPEYPDYYPSGFTFSGAEQVVPADVDGDGDADLVAISSYRDKLAWYENDGQPVTPGFAEHVVVDNPYGPYGLPRPLPAATSVAIGDLDGDGDLDLLSASAKDDKIAWYENQGISPVAFTSHVISQDPDGPWILEGEVEDATWVSSADLDGDGDLDVLAASFYGAARWFQNQGGAASWVSFDLGKHVDDPGPDDSSDRHIILAADLDGDGDLDLARHTGRYRFWQENSGGATPSFALRQPDPTDGRGLSIGDLDGDGDLDLVSGADSGVYWFENVGSSPRRFTGHLLSSAHLLAAPRAVHAVDFDGDGDLDVLVAAEGPDLWKGGIHLLENRAGDASKWVWRALSLAAQGASSVHAADLNADAHLDAVSTAHDGDEVVWHPWRGPPNVSLKLTLESHSQAYPFEPVTFSGVGVAQVESSGAGTLERLELVAGFVGNGSGRAISPPATGFQLVAARPALGLATGSFERGAGARIPLTGWQRLCFLYAPNPTEFCLQFPLSEAGRGAGVGGTVDLYNPFATVGSRFSVLGAPWTVGTASATGYTPSGPPSVATFSARGFAHGPLSNTGSTALSGGALQLVTPIVLVDNLSGTDTHRRLVDFARLTVRFIPEPAAGAGLVAGALTLVWLGRRRARRGPEPGRPRPAG